MLYITTGANGAGKTLFTLKDVRERQLKENRPVYHNGRFRLKREDFGWKQIDFKDWQTVPDGAIFLIDECHNDMPLRKGASEPPEHIRMLAEHRVRGFDFYLITQHPANIDIFVRRLVGSPGWHRHLKNVMGSPLVSHLTWSHVNNDCEKPNSGANGEVSMHARPKEVFDWYESATLHTGKPKIPYQVYVLGAAVIAVPVLLYFAYSAFAKTTAGVALNGSANTAKTEQSSIFSPSVAHHTPAQESRPKTQAEYLADYNPRLPGLPHTAPRYDKLMEAKTAPTPSACIATSERCKCYTSQATVLDVSDFLCRDIVKKGYFSDWVQPEERENKPLQIRPPAA